MFSLNTSSHQLPLVLALAPGGCSSCLRQLSLVSSASCHSEHCYSLSGEKWLTSVLKTVLRDLCWELWRHFELSRKIVLGFQRPLDCKRQLVSVTQVRSSSFSFISAQFFFSQSRGSSHVLIDLACSVCLEQHALLAQAPLKLESYYYLPPITFLYIFSYVPPQQTSNKIIVGNTRLRNNVRLKLRRRSRTLRPHHFLSPQILAEKK